MRFLNGLIQCIGEYSALNWFLYSALSGIMVVLEPEQRVKTVTVYTKKAIGVRPEKTVSYIAFNIDSFAPGLEPWTPLMNVMT